MIQRMLRARAWFEALSRSERIAMLAAGVLGLLVLFETLSWSPARRQLSTTALQTSSLEEQRTSLEGELGSLDEHEALDPDAAVRRQIGKLEGDIGEIDAQLRDQALQILAPEQVRLVLRDLIDNVQGLRLVSMQTEAPVQLVNTAPEDLPALYRHGLVIDLQGEYLALLDYVRALEALPWRFYWLGIDVRADEPGARSFRLHLYTVSLRKEWIRV